MGLIEPGRNFMKLSGADTSGTGITLPVTKHNYLVLHAENIAPVVRQAFRVATSDRPAAVLVNITKNEQQEQAAWIQLLAERA